MELTSNNIAISEWNILKLKAEQFQNIEFVKQFLSSNDGNVTVAHLIALLVYVNFDQIQRKFRQTFFKVCKDYFDTNAILTLSNTQMSMEETNKGLKFRHSIFSHFSREFIA